MLSRPASSKQEELCVMALDIPCAFLYAKVKRTLYVLLPVEDEVIGGRGLRRLGI